MNQNTRELLFSIPFLAIAFAVGAFIGHVLQVAKNEDHRQKIAKECAIECKETLQGTLPEVRSGVCFCIEPH